MKAINQFDLEYCFFFYFNLRYKILGKNIFCHSDSLFCLAFYLLSLITSFIAVDQLKKSYGSFESTVNALLVPAGTILFVSLEVRVLFKRGYYLRAGTIANFAISKLKIW